MDDDVDDDEVDVDDIVTDDDHDVFHKANSKRINSAVNLLTKTIL